MQSSRCYPMVWSLGKKRDEEMIKQSDPVLYWQSNNNNRHTFLGKTKFRSKLKMHGVFCFF